MRRALSGLLGMVFAACAGTAHAQLRICTHPIEFEIHRLRAMIDGTPERTQWVADAINYLTAKYCRTTTDNVPMEERTPVSVNCYQASGHFRGEKVYWGLCYAPR